MSGERVSISSEKSIMLRLETCSKAEDVTTQPFLHLGGHVTTSYQWTMSGGDVWHFQEEVAKKRVPPPSMCCSRRTSVVPVRWCIRDLEEAELRGGKSLASRRPTRGTRCLR